MVLETRIGDWIVFALGAKHNNSRWSFSFARGDNALAIRFFGLKHCLSLEICTFANGWSGLFLSILSNPIEPMRVVIQRVREASVTIDGRLKSAIGAGMLILLGIEEADGQADIDWLVKKIVGLRIYNDEAGVMNRNILDAGGEALVVSQFTLMASTKKGNRPSYIRAARPETAIPLYEAFCEALSVAMGFPCQTGEFGADMAVKLLNDGPVTICMDTKNKE